MFEPFLSSIWAVLAENRPFWCKNCQKCAKNEILKIEVGRIFCLFGAPKKSIFQAKSGQTELKNEANMSSIALDEFTLVSGG